MIRRILLALIFGTSIGFLAERYSGAAAGIVAGLFSAMGFAAASFYVRSRMRTRQGETPVMEEGEEALLHGPCSILRPDAAPQKVWAYLSNRRLSLRGQQDSMAVDLKLDIIEELRPRPKGMMVVVRGWGNFDLEFPDVPRWTAALRAAVRR